MNTNNRNIKEFEREVIFDLFYKNSPYNLNVEL